MIDDHGGTYIETYIIHGQDTKKKREKKRKMVILFNKKADSWMYGHLLCVLSIVVGEVEIIVSYISAYFVTAM